MIYLDKEENFDDLIKEGTVLVDFSATWCGPCKMLEGELENIEDKIKIVKVDIDKFQKLTMNYRIMSVPTMIFFKDGEKSEEVIGFHTSDELLEVINGLK